jgi:hypothetical protein
MDLDDRAFEALIEESRDLHSDAMRDTHTTLQEMVDVGREPQPEPDDEVDRHRRALLSRGVQGGTALAATGLGAGLLAIMAQPAFADQTMDVQMLQTAASIENLAVATYTAALSLPFAGTLPQVVQTFISTTRSQHTEHAAAFNAAVKALGGKEQTQPNPVLLQTVNAAKPKLTNAGAVVALAIQLEQGAAETYVAYTSAYTDKNARNTTASIMGVEAQHVAILNIVHSLIQSNNTDLLTLPPNLSRFPANGSTVAFPDSFFKTDMARPANEGAVQ